MKIRNYRIKINKEINSAGKRAFLFYLVRTRPRIVVAIVVYSLQKVTHYYTRWRKYASEQKLTSSPLKVRVYALSTFADTTRLTPFGYNTKLDFSTYRGQLAIEVLHVLKALAQYGLISSPLTPTPLCRSTPILPSRPVLIL